MRSPRRLSVVWSTRLWIGFAIAAVIHLVLFLPGRLAEPQNEERAFAGSAEVKRAAEEPMEVVRVEGVSSSVPQPGPPAPALAFRATVSAPPAPLPQLTRASRDRRFTSTRLTGGTQMTGPSDEADRAAHAKSGRSQLAAEEESRAQWAIFWSNVPVQTGDQAQLLRMFACDIDQIRPEDRRKLHRLFESRGWPADSLFRVLHRRAERRDGDCY